MDRNTANLVTRLAKRRRISRLICTCEHPMPDDAKSGEYVHLDTLEIGGETTCLGCGCVVRGGLRLFNPEMAAC